MIDEGLFKFRDSPMEHKILYNTLLRTITSFNYRSCRRRPSSCSRQRGPGLKPSRSIPGKTIWWFSPMSGLLYPRYYLVLYKIFYSAMLVLACLGINSLLKKRVSVRQEVYLLLFFLTFLSLFQALYYVEGRHRWSVEPILMIFSAAGILKLTNKFLERTNAEV